MRTAPCARLGRALVVAAGVVSLTRRVDIAFLAGVVGYQAAAWSMSSGVTVSNPLLHASVTAT